MSSGTLGGQKRTLDPLELEVTNSCELLCRFWELNLGSLQGHQVLVTIEPSPLKLPF